MIIKNVEINEKTGVYHVTYLTADNGPLTEIFRKYTKDNLPGDVAKWINCNIFVKEADDRFNDIRTIIGNYTFKDGKPIYRYPYGIEPLFFEDKENNEYFITTRPALSHALEVNQENEENLWIGETVYAVLEDYEKDPGVYAFIKDLLSDTDILLEGELEV